LDSLNNVNLLNPQRGHSPLGSTPEAGVAENRCEEPIDVELLKRLVARLIGRRPPSSGPTRIRTLVFECRATVHPVADILPWQ
jgi:hypothetical protein